MRVVCEKEKHVSYSTSCSVKNFCCRMMKKAIGSNGHSYYSSVHYRNVLFVDECGVKMGVRVSETGYLSGVELIRFCPFCGQEIEHG